MTPEAAWEAFCGLLPNPWPEPLEGELRGVLVDLVRRCERRAVREAQDPLACSRRLRSDARMPKEEEERLLEAALHAADHLRAHLELAATSLEILSSQLKSGAFADRDSLLALAGLAETAAEQARQAAEPA